MSTAGYRRDNADFIAILQLRLLILEEANILFVHIDIDEAAHGPRIIEQAFLDAGIARLQFGESVADGLGIDFDQFFVVRQFAQWSWDSNFLCHKSLS